MDLMLRTRRMRHLALACLLIACGRAGQHHGDDTGGDDEPQRDASISGDSAPPVDAASGDDSGTFLDAPQVGIITGGPCVSGQAGKAAYRVRWAKSGSTAYVQYEVNGLPTKTPDRTGAYGYQIGFTPQYVDPFLAEGGLQLDASDFVDIELSTAGITTITSAKIAIYGRSFNTTASGSFNWQTLDDVDSTPTNFVSNVAPYAWYAGDATAAIRPGKASMLIRIKAGPNSGALVVNRIELCLQAT
jgi:hypothetical protein